MKKKTRWVIVFPKYGKFWSVSLGYFVKHKHLISEKCLVIFFLGNGGHVIDNGFFVTWWFVCAMVMTIGKKIKIINVRGNIFNPVQAVFEFCWINKNYKYLWSFKMLFNSKIFIWMFASNLWSCSSGGKYPCLGKCNVVK